MTCKEMSSLINASGKNNENTDEKIEKLKREKIIEYYEWIKNFIS